MTNIIKRFSVIVAAALTLVACSENDHMDTLISCGEGMLKGVIKTDLFSAVDDLRDNLTHASGSCSDLEYCVKIFGTSSDYACSEVAEGHLLCDGIDIDARKNNDHCGHCGNRCNEKESCNEGVCTLISQCAVENCEPVEGASVSVTQDGDHCLCKYDCGEMEFDASKMQCISD